MTVVHEGVEERAGEAMAGGGIVLSWRNVLESGWGDGFNVVAHELAHKLDMRNGGEANGFPPLHGEMSRLRWTETMEFGFADLARRIERDEDAPVDDGAAEDAGEFFAFCAESFLRRRTCCGRCGRGFTRSCVCFTARIRRRGCRNERAGFCFYSGGGAA